MIRDGKNVKPHHHLYKHLSSDDEDKDKLTSNSSWSCSRQLVIVFVLWYLFSLITLFYNKFILMNPANDPTILGLLLCEFDPKHSNLILVN
jgi:hypothetical protein